MKTALLPLCLSSVLLFIGCGQKQSDQPQAPSDLEVASAELFISRASLTDAEFEQYKIISDKLFKECGKIRGGRYVAETQDFSRMKGDYPERLRERLIEVAQTISGPAEVSFEDPGDSDTLFDPGQFYLTLETSRGKLRVRTSLDSISDPSSNVERDLNQVASLVRGAAGGSLCKNSEFFGLAAE